MRTGLALDALASGLTRVALVALRTGLALDALASGITRSSVSSCSPCSSRGSISSISTVSASWALGADVVPFEGHFLFPAVVRRVDYSRLPRGVDAGVDLFALTSRGDCPRGSGCGDE